MRILLIEDDRLIGSIVLEGLLEAGFVVDWVGDARAAELSLATGVYDLAVLDLGLPRGDGMEVLKAARRCGSRLPIIIASARDSPGERIAGLTAGADDFLSKPFDVAELVARIRALLRRHAGHGCSILRHGDLALDPVQREVWLGSRRVDLSTREFSVLEALMQRPGAVLSRERLETAIYGWGREVASNAIEVHLHHLRRKLGSDRIRNVRGAGYCMAAEP